MSQITSNTNPQSYVDYLSEELLAQVMPQLHLNEYAMKKKLPQNVGSKVVDFFRHDKPNSSNVQNLVEGTPISTFRTITLTRVQASLAQYGEAVRVSDITNATSRYDFHQMGTKLLAQDFAIKVDDTSRNVIVTNVTGTSNASQAKYSAGTSFSDLSSATSAPLRYTDLIVARTTLKVNNVMGWGQGSGEYVAIVPSQCYHDLLLDATIREIVRYPKESEQLFKGELGKFGNVRLVEVNNPFQETSGGTEGQYSPSGTIFSTITLGKDAFGVVDIASQAALSPKIQIVDTPDSGNPLNQYETIGYKAYYTSVLLNPEFLCVTRSKTSFV